MQDDLGGCKPVFVEGASTFYISIIDMLQKWDYNKKSEYYAKTWLKRLDKYGISAVEPTYYRDRFVSRVCECGGRGGRLQEYG